MQLLMLNRPVSARRRGMPGIAMFGKHFFRRFWQPASADYGTATLGEDTVGEVSAEMQLGFTDEANKATSTLLRVPRPRC